MPPRRFPNLTQEQRDELAMQFVACKGPIRHRWDLVPAGEERPEFGTLVMFRCDNCGTYRREIWSRVIGRLLSRSYIHPEGYRDAGRDAADERMSSEGWRALFAEAVMAREPDLLIDAEVQVPVRKKAAAKRGGRANVVDMPNRRATV